MTAYVYRVFDADDALIYIGSTTDVERRMRAHFTSDHSCGDPFTIRARYAYLTIEQHPDLPTARQAERAAIAAEAPLVNVTGNEKRYPLAPPPKSHVIAHHPGWAARYGVPHRPIDPVPYPGLIVREVPA